MAATREFGHVQAVYAPTRREAFRLTVVGTIGKVNIELRTRGVKSTVFLNNELVRTATEACRRLEVVTGLSLPTQGTSAVRVLHDLAIDRGFRIEFR